MPSVQILFPQFVQVLVREFGDDDEFAGHDLDAIDREEERMADRLDELQGAQFFCRRERYR